MTPDNSLRRMFAWSLLGRLTTWPSDALFRQATMTFGTMTFGTMTVRQNARILINTTPKTSNEPLEYFFVDLFGVNLLSCPRLSP